MQNRCRDRIDLINGLINRSNIYPTQVICAFDRLSMVTYVHNIHIVIIRIVMSDELVLYTYVYVAVNIAYIIFCNGWVDMLT